MQSFEGLVGSIDFSSVVDCVLGGRLTRHFTKFNANKRFLTTFFYNLTMIKHT